MNPSILIRALALLFLAAIPAAIAQQTVSGPAPEPDNHRPIRAGDRIYLQCANSGRFMIDTTTYLGWDIARAGHGESKETLRLMGTLGRNASEDANKAEEPMPGSPAFGAPVTSGHILGIEFIKAIKSGKDTPFGGATRMYESIEGWAYLDNPAGRAQNDKFWWKMTKYVPPPANVFDLNAQKQWMEQMKDGQPIKEGDMVVFENQFYKKSFLTSGRRGGEWQYLSCAPTPDPWRVFLTAEAPKIVPQPKGNATSEEAVVWSAKFVENETAEASGGTEETFEIEQSDIVGISTSTAKAWQISATAAFEVGGEKGAPKVSTSVTGAYGEEYNKTVEEVKSTTFKKSINQKFQNLGHANAIYVVSMIVPYSIQEYSYESNSAFIRRMAGAPRMGTTRTLSIPHREGDKVIPLRWSEVVKDYLSILEKSDKPGAQRVKDKKAAWVQKGWIEDDSIDDTRRSAPEKNSSRVPQTKYSITLEAAGANKLATVKAVRSATGMSLAEAKALVEKAPSSVKEGLSEAEANKLKAEFEAAGATVTIK